jgi:tetratricopeptide (TPR) repeat protein
MDITVVFNGDRITESKKVAIEIANDHGAVKSGGMFKVKFDKKSHDLIKLLYLCMTWKLSHVLINGKQMPASDVYDVLTCDEKRECNGKCQRGYPGYIDLIDEIGACVKNEDCDSDWIQEILPDLDSFEKQPDGSFKINKTKLKNNIEKKYAIPISVCEKIDINKIFNQIDELPDVFSISGFNEELEESSYFKSNEKEKLIETAKIVAPILAEVIAKELDKVIIANFGNEKNALSCAKKADALFSLQRYDESLEFYDKALEMDATNSIIWYEKGLLLEIGFENYEKAIDAYNRAFEIDPNNLPALRGMGCCLESLGKDKEAIATFEKAIKLYEERLVKNPNDKGAKEELQLIKESLSALKG